MEFMPLLDRRRPAPITRDDIRLSTKALRRATKGGIWLRGAIVVLWRAALLIREALALNEYALDPDYVFASAASSSSGGGP